MSFYEVNLSITVIVESDDADSAQEKAKGWAAQNASEYDFDSSCDEVSEDQVFRQSQNLVNVIYER